MSEKIIGQVLKNQFRVDEFIGSGSMSVVYRVWDLKRNTPLAMKILQSELADDPSMFNYFRRGANALKKLAHPHIVPFYGLERTDAFAFALEGYIKGPNVKDILRQQGKQPLPLLDALCVMKAVCSALGYAHANGVVHCDVKPGNIMVDAGGNVYLTDFGIARHADSTTTTMGAAGTPAYMAPEQIRGEAVNAATDVYAMGIMLYEMVTGRRPFEGKDLKTSSSETGATQANLIRTAHLTQAPPDPRGFNTRITPEMVEVMLKALEKVPQDRYQDIMAFFNAFCAAAGVPAEQIPERLLKYVPEAEPISAPGPVGGMVPARQMPVKKALPFILGGAGLVVALVLIFTLKQNPDSNLSLAFNPTDTGQVTTATERPPTNTPAPTPTPAPSLTPTQVPTPTSTPDSVVGYDLAFASDRNGDFSIFLMNTIDRTSWINLPPTGGYQLTWWPSFCGRYIAAEVQASNRQWIYLIDPVQRDGTQWNPSIAGTKLGVPRCSPSGEYLAYSNHDGSNWGFYIAHSDGSAAFLVDDSLGYGSWTGNNNRLYWMTTSFGIRYATNVLQAGFSYQRIQPSGGYPAASPDGSQVAYACNGDDLCIWNMASESGSTIHSTTVDRSINVRWLPTITPFWSADGQWIYFAATDGGDWDIFRIHPDGSGLENVTEDWSSSNEVMPAMQW